MNPKIKLQKKFDSIQDPTLIINKYEENKLFFNELQSSGIKENIEFVIQIKLCKYVDSLIKQKQYKKAIEILDGANIELNKIKGTSKLYQTYEEGSIFLRGVSLSKLKKYNASNIEFEKIIQKDPLNDNYKNWYSFNKKKCLTKIFNWISILGLVLYATIIILDTILDIDKTIYTAIKFAGLLTILLSLIIPFFLKSKSIKKSTGWRK